MADDQSAALQGRTPEMVQSDSNVSGNLCVECHNTAHVPCCVTKLTVNCSHAARGYKLTVPSKPTRGHGYVLQVTGTSEKPDTIAVSLDGGPCVMGKPGAIGTGGKISKNLRQNAWPSASVTGNDLSINAAAPYCFDAIGPSDDEVGSWSGLLRLITSSDAFMQSYSVSVTACAGVQDLTATVEVYPPVKGKGSLSFGYDSSPVVRKRAAESGSHEAFKFKAEGELDFGNSKRKIGIEAFDKTGGRLEDVLFPGMRNVLHPLCRFMDATNDKGDSKLKFIPPNITTSFEISREEKRGDWRIDSALKLKLDFSPLIGLEDSYDLLPPLVRLAGNATTLFAGPMGPVIGEIIASALARRSRDGHFDIGLDFTTTGTIKGALSWAVPEAAAGSLVGTIELDLKGSFKVEYHCWIVKAGGAGKVGANAKGGARVAAGYDDGFAATGQLFFEGLKIYYAYSVDVGFGDAAEPPSEPKTGSKLTADNDVDSWTLLEAAAWPESSANTKLASDFF